MNLLVAVSCYAGDAHQVENNFKYYSHHGVPVIVLSPENAPVRQIEKAESTETYYHQLGQAGWIGPHTLGRQKKFLQVLQQQSEFDYFIFHDADSVCLSPKLPSYLFKNSDIFFSNEMPNYDGEPSFLPKVAFEPPFVFSRRVLERLLLFADRPAHSYPVDSVSYSLSSQAIDHFMLRIAESAGVPHRPFFDGAGFNTQTSEGLEAMLESVREGGKIFLHSIKTMEVLQRVEEARKQHCEKYEQR